MSRETALFPSMCSIQGRGDGLLWGYYIKACVAAVTSNYNTYTDKVWGLTNSFMNFAFTLLFSLVSKLETKNFLRKPKNTFIW